MQTHTGGYSPVDDYEHGVEQAELFDWSLFGAVLRNRRKRMGYAKATDFSTTIYNRTRMAIPPATIHKIEAGKQSVSSMQLMAICLSLNWSPNIGEFFRLCASDEWQEVASGHVPHAWRVENTAAMAMQYCGEDADAARVMETMEAAGAFERGEVFTGE